MRIRICFNRFSISMGKSCVCVVDCAMEGCDEILPAQCRRKLSTFKRFPNNVSVQKHWSKWVGYRCRFKMVSASVDPLYVAHFNWSRNIFFNTCFKSSKITVFEHNNLYTLLFFFSWFEQLKWKRVRAKEYICLGLFAKFGRIVRWWSHTCIE